MSQIRWQGRLSCITHAFKKDETIDFGMFSLNLEAQVEAGIEGVVIGGSLGESSTLEKNELMELLKFSRQHLPGKIPVIVNISGAIYKCGKSNLHRHLKKMVLTD